MVVLCWNFWLDSPITSGPNPRGHFRRRMGAAGVQHLPYHPVSLGEKDQSWRVLWCYLVLFEWNLAKTVLHIDT